MTSASRQDSLTAQRHRSRTNPVMAANEDQLLARGSPVALFRPQASVTHSLFIVLDSGACRAYRAITVDEPAVRDLPQWLAPAFVGRPLEPATVPKGVKATEQGRKSSVQVDVSWDSVVATVTVTGELSLTTATTLTRRLLAVAAERPGRLVLDLSGLVYADVGGAQELEGVHTLLQAECPVVVRQPPPSARRVFGVTGLIEDQGSSPTLTQ